MNLKTYRAGSMAAALAEVKKDLGKDAVILHTRSYKVGAVMGVGGRQVIEVTAADQDGTRGPRIRGASAQRGQGAPPRAVGQPVPASVAIAEPPASVLMDTPGEDEFTATPIPSVSTRPVAIETIVPRPPRQSASPEDPAAPKKDRPPKPPLAPKAVLTPVDGAAMGSLQSELASIKRLVGQVLQCSRQTAYTVGGRGSQGAAPSAMEVGGLPDHLFALHMRLQESRVSIELADAVAGAVRDELNPDELADAEIVRQAVLRHLATKIPVVGGMTRAGDGGQGRPVTIALVGPTGVGKTTTVAKLAAAYKLRHAKRVGLVTSDTYRIAAVDQLRTYANIIGLPLRVVLTPKEMAGACESLSDCDVILVDTAGRSQHDASRLEELSAFIEAAAPDETHLVLAATVAEPVLFKTADRFARLKPGRVLLSKLDEATEFGPIVNVTARAGLPVSYVTTGQEVPDHIEVANADRLARLILDGELAR